MDGFGIISQKIKSHIGCRFQNHQKIGDRVMTREEYQRLAVHIAMLEDIAEEYPGKTIENIIAQLVARRKEIDNSVEEQ